MVHPGFDGALEETTMINTVEEFIEQVIDPDDVQEEEIWYDSPRHYYTDDLPVEVLCIHTLISWSVLRSY